jgi:hypothetical protein
MEFNKLSCLASKWMWCTRHGWLGWIKNQTFHFLWNIGILVQAVDHFKCNNAVVDERFPFRCNGNANVGGEHGNKIIDQPCISQNIIVTVGNNKPCCRIDLIWIIVTSTKKITSYWQITFQTMPRT